MQYIAERRACTGNPLAVMSARKSFPSKDAALSVYSSVYTVVGWSMAEVIERTNPATTFSLYSMASVMQIDTKFA